MQNTEIKIQLSMVMKLNLNGIFCLTVDHECPIDIIRDQILQYFTLMDSINY